MVRLSIIIPALSAQRLLDDTLVSVLEHRPSGCEVIVVHGPGYVDPYDLADEVTFVLADREGLLPLVNRGIAASRGQYLHILQPGVEVEADWCESVVQRFAADRNVGCVAPLISDNRRPGKPAVIGVARHALTGARLVRLPSGGRPYQEMSWVMAPTLVAAFYDGSVMRTLGRFTESFGPLADLDWGLRMVGAGYRCVVEPNCRVRTSMMQHTAATARGFDAARMRERFRWRESPATWSRSVRRLVSGLAAELLISFPRPALVPSVLGRLAGWLDGILQLGEGAAAPPRGSHSAADREAHPIHLHQAHAGAEKRRPRAIRPSSAARPPAE